MDVLDLYFDGVFKFLDEITVGSRSISYLYGYLLGCLPPIFLYGIIVSIVTACVCSIIRAVTI